MSKLPGSTGSDDERPDREREREDRAAPSPSTRPPGKRRRGAVERRFARKGFGGVADADYGFGGSAGARMAGHGSLGDPALQFRLRCPVSGCQRGTMIVTAMNGQTCPDHGTVLIEA